MKQTTEQRKAELKAWVEKNCILAAVDVDSLINSMYAELETAEFKHSFEEAQKEYLEAKKVLTDAQASYKKIKDIREQLCPHTTIISKENYVSGSYNDTAYTDHWKTCECCGYSTPRVRENHSWYG
jgi:hypothetical protein